MNACALLCFHINTCSRPVAAASRPCRLQKRRRGPAFLPKRNQAGRSTGCHLYDKRRITHARLTGHLPLVSKALYSIQTEIFKKKRFDYPDVGRSRPSSPARRRRCCPSGRPSSAARRTASRLWLNQYRFDCKTFRLKV